MPHPARRGPLLIAASLSFVATVATVLAPLGAPADALPERPGSAFVQQFGAADTSHGAMFRWWWTSAVDTDVAVQQLRQVAAAGYKGVEIAFVMDGVSYVVDTDEHEYGDAGWRAAVRAVLAEANRLGVQVDLTLGGRWPAAFPGLDVSSDAASQELTTGNAVVAAGARFDQALPQPAPLTYEDRTMEDGKVVTTSRTSPASYVAATATRCVDACGGATPVLDLETVVDLSADVADGNLDWTAPAEGTWVVTSYWRRGTAQRNDAPFGSSLSPWSEPESRVVDHFGAAGTEAILTFFGGLLDGPTRRLLRKNGGSLFEDSLELKHAQAWTPAFLDAFEETNGYRIEPYLPVLAKLDATGPFAEPEARYAWAAGQDEVATRVSHDVEETLDDLYVTEHVRPIRAWANRLGLGFRAQPYGEAIDLGGAAQELDVSECESLGCTEDQFRALAGGVTAAGKNLLSSEMLPGGFGNLYGLTPAEIAALANKEYSFGANQMVFHGLPYRDLPPAADGSQVDTAAAWPGFHAFSARIGEAFGPRQPAWTMEPAMGDYYARIQQVLQAGTARYDVAVLDGGGAFLGDTDLTYSYLTADSLAGLPVVAGRLAPDRASYGALVVGSDPIDFGDGQGDRAGRRRRSAGRRPGRRTAARRRICRECNGRRRGGRRDRRGVRPDRRPPHWVRGHRWSRRSDAPGAAGSAVGRRTRGRCRGRTSRVRCRDLHGSLQPRDRRGIDEGVPPGPGWHGALPARSVVGQGHRDQRLQEGWGPDRDRPRPGGRRLGAGGSRRQVLRPRRPAGSSSRDEHPGRGRAD